MPCGQSDDRYIQPLIRIINGAVKNKFFLMPFMQDSASKKVLAQIQFIIV
jgi:hypothetical protein